MCYLRDSPISMFSVEVTYGHFPQDKAKVEIRKPQRPPKAETIRDMVRYANVIEEFPRAKTTNISFATFLGLDRGVGELGTGSREKGGFLSIEGKTFPIKGWLRVKTYWPSTTCSQLRQCFTTLPLFFCVGLVCSGAHPVGRLLFSKSGEQFLTPLIEYLLGQGAPYFGGFAV